MEFSIYMSIFKYTHLKYSKILLTNSLKYMKHVKNIQCYLCHSKKLQHVINTFKYF